jgi:type III pantothenate kinase
VIAGKPLDTSCHLLLVDIGNSHGSLATWADDRIGDVERLGADDLLAPAVERAWKEIPASARRAVVISSVCPPRLEELRAVCTSQGIAPLHVVGEDLAPPIGIDVDEPEKVGTDRLCAAAGAFARVKSACVVADFGTALTIDLVADNNVFLGGTILPGVALSARALHEHTALLPLVEVGTPGETLGRDTTSAIRNGIFAMMVGALREIAERYATQVGRWMPLIVTGGDAAAVAGACDFVDGVAPNLCLEGLVLAYRAQAGLQDGREDQ